MGLHILWLVIWLISGVAGWGVAAITGLVVGQAVADSRTSSGWGFVWVPVIWLVGAAWGIFALVHTILEFVTIIISLIQASVA